MNNEIVKRFEDSTLRKTIKNNRASSSNAGDTNISKKRKLIIIGITISVFILIGIFLVVYFVEIKDLINKKEKNDNPTDQINTNNTDNIDESKPEDPFEVIIPKYKKANEKLESEFEFKTLVGDLRRIQVLQRYDEDRLYEGQEIQRKKIRNTTYDIFIISESNPTEDFIKYYDKRYNAAISIVSECFASEDEECIPKTLVDLSGTEVHNTRNLEEKDDLRDIPIPVCLFNLT